MTSRPASLIWDLHVHAAPSSTPRWGNDLDLVSAAQAHGLRGFVLKSHHESTAGRAVIANAFAARIGAPVTVLGAIVLNPWITLPEVERAINLGARVIWWPTRDDDGKSSGLALPGIHRPVLERAAAAHCIVATGHLSPEAAEELVSDAAGAGLTVVASHPFNPLVGIGASAARRLGMLGAVVEVDAYSLHLLEGNAAPVAAEVTLLLGQGVRVVLSSDGGQAVTGEPFEFAARALRSLQAAGLEDDWALIRTADSIVATSA